MVRSLIAKIDSVDGLIADASVLPSLVLRFMNSIYPPPTLVSRSLRTVFSTSSPIETMETKAKNILASIGDNISYSCLPVIASLLLYDTASNDPYHLTKILALSIGLLCLAFYKKPKAGPLDLPIGVFLLSLIASALLAGDWWGDFFGQRTFYFNGAFPSILCAMCYSFSLGTDQDKAERTILWSASAVAVVGLMQLFGWILPYPMSEGTRIYSVAGSPVHVSLVIAIGAILGIMRKSPLAILCLVALCYTETRAGFVAVAAGLVPLAWNSRYRTWFIVAIILSTILGMSWVVWVRDATPESDHSRMMTWVTAVKAWRVHPWFGWGPDSFDKAYIVIREAHTVKFHGAFRVAAQAHNWFLQSLAATGLVGLSALAYLAYSASRLPLGRAFPIVLAVSAFGFFQPTSFYSKAVLASLLGAALPATGIRSPYPPRVFLGIVSAVYLMFAVGSRIERAALDSNDGGLYFRAGILHPGK